MAIRWDFNHKGGTVTQEHGGTHNWYEGNGLMIVLNEWEEKGINIIPCTGSLRIKIT